MMRPLSLTATAFLAAALGACSINVDENGVNHYQGNARANAEALDDGRRIIIVEQEERDRARASDIIDGILDRARDHDCDTLNVDARRRLYDIHDGDDVRGLRVVLSCPRDVEIF